MVKNFFYIFFIFSFLFLVLSCAPGSFLSNQVLIAEWSENGGNTPIVFLNDEERVVCRRGLPLDYIPPWDKEAKRVDQEPFGAAGSSNVERKQAIVTQAKAPWLRVGFEIKNNTPFHLVIHTIGFTVLGQSSSNQQQNTPKSFTAGYCDTDPIYWLKPKEGFGRLDHSKSYVVGNLIFVVDSLPKRDTPVTQQGGQNATDPLFFTQPTPIPSYQIRWYMLGVFKNDEGQQAGQFYQRGQFNARSLSF